MITASSDQRHYTFHTLENQLQVLWIKDTKADHAAIGLSVNCGSFNDPDDIPGLMHLMEHLFFGGSHHFPEKGELVSWIERLPGAINAWTSPEYTSFSMHTPVEHFAEAITRFVDMLAAPLFSPPVIAAEIQTIDAEFKAKIKDENRRIQDVHKATCNPAHPFHRFAVGNQQIFQQFDLDYLQETLQLKHKNHYVSEAMRVCIVAPELPQDLITFIQARLADIPSGPAPPSQYREIPLHLPTHLHKLITITPRKSFRQLVFSFDVSKLDVDYRRKPDGLISHLIGYEGPGSLLYLWKQLGWATQLLVGIGLEGDGFREFNINIQLTPQGEQQIPGIAASIFHFIELIKSDSKLEQHYQEKSRLNTLALEYANNTKAHMLSQQISLNMHHYQQPHWVVGEYLMEAFKEDEVQHFLNGLKLEYCRMVLVSPDAETTSITGLYQAKYGESVIPAMTVAKDFNAILERELSLPGLNPYIPNIEANPKRQQSVPKIVKDLAPHKIFLGSNNQIEMARGESYLSLIDTTPTAQSIQNVALRKCWAYQLQTQMNEHFYDATIAGSFFNIYAHQTGIGIHTSGFSDKQLQLLYDITIAIQHSFQDCSKFDVYKQQYVNSLHNKLLNKPLNLLFTCLQAIVVESAYLPQDLAKQLQNVTCKELNDSKSKTLNNSVVEGLFFGDWSQQQLNEMVKSLPLPAGKDANPVQHPVLKLNHIAESCYVLPCSQDESALVLYLQGENDSLCEQALLMLIESFLGSFYFNWMRNSKNMGYNVGSGYLPFNEFPGISLYVQSPTHGVAALYRESLSCINAFTDWLAAYPEPNWQQHNQHLIAQLINPNVNLTIACQRMWHSIGQQDLKFDRLERMAKHLSALTKEQVVAELQRRLARQAPFFVLHTPISENETKPDCLATPLTDIYRYKHH
ncbi:MAG: insulinase family protein [Aestuariibacter sp.]